jgi:serine/threonine-protein kinase
MAEDYFGIVGTTQAGAYRVEAVVAEGGFGVVYRAYHDAFQAPVALKCLKIPGAMNADHQQEFLVKFREEAALLFRLSASIPAVVRPLHVDRLITPDGRFVPFMALEWLEGEGLDQLINRRAAAGMPPLGMKKVVRLLSPVARALARAHHFPGPNGPVAIVHRDIKPDNIFIARVNGEEVVKIFDFGIAKARSVATQVAGKVSQGGSMTAFTPGYGAPEQWLPKRFGQSGPWTDVFGLALTVLEASSGRAIIDGDTAGMMGTACDEKRRPSPRNEGMEVTDEVEAVFLGALAVDPRRRYPDAGAFWDALETALGLEMSATPTMGGTIRARDLRSDGPPAGRVETTSTRPAPPSIRPAAGSPAIAPIAAMPLPSIPDIELGPVPPKRSGSGQHPAVRPEAAPSPPPPAARVAPPPAPDSRSSEDDEEPSFQIALDEGANVRSPKTGAEPAPQSRGPADATGARQALSTSGTHHRPSPSGTSGSHPRPALSTSGVHQAPPASKAMDAPMPRRARQPTQLDRIRVPLYVGFGGLVVIVLEQIYDKVAGGGLLALGPLRVTYIAGGLIAFGVLGVMKRLIADG